MKDNTLTMGLSGVVPLPVFARAIREFSDLVAALSADVAAGVDINWIIQDLEAGSATATVRSESDDLQAVDRVIDAYPRVGAALQSQKIIPFSPRVRQVARRLTGLLVGEVTAIQFQTAETEVFISAPAKPGERAKLITYALGTAVKGGVETLTRRRSLRFTIYDQLFDRAIVCYLHEGQEEQMRDAWGKRAHVAGRVGRDPDRGYPIVVRDISEIRILPTVAPGSYRSARGIISLGGERPEDIIRRIRGQEHHP